MSSVIDPQSSSGPKQFVAGRKIGMIHGSQGLLLASLPDCYPYHPNTVGGMAGCLGLVGS